MLAQRQPSPFDRNEGFIPVPENREGIVRKTDSNFRSFVGNLCQVCRLFGASHDVGPDISIFPAFFLFRIALSHVSLLHNNAGKSTAAGPASSKVAEIQQLERVPQTGRVGIYKSFPCGWFLQPETGWWFRPPGRNERSGFGGASQSDRAGRCRTPGDRSAGAGSWRRPAG